MAEESLECRLDFDRRTAGSYGLLLSVVNGGQAPKVVRFPVPFLDFELRVTLQGTRVEVVSPIFDGGAQMVVRELAPGQRAQLDTPVRLVFDPDVPPSGGEDPNRWAIVHAPATVQVSATVRLGGRRLPCAAVLDPTGSWPL